jgi:hypothetical protein
MKYIFVVQFAVYSYSSCCQRSVRMFFYISSTIARIFFDKSNECLVEMNIKRFYLIAIHKTVIVQGFRRVGECRELVLISKLCHIFQCLSRFVYFALSYQKPNPKAFRVYFHDVASFMKVQFDVIHLQHLFLNLIYKTKIVPIVFYLF